MIAYVTGDLFESPAQTLVNTVNTVGVMGKGIALRFKQIYPEMFREYQDLCERKVLEVGKLHVYRTSHKTVLNFPTKRDWRRPSRPEYIQAGLETFVLNYERMGITSAAFPPLGCGNGELDFDTCVQPLMESYLGSLPIQVFIYAPQRSREVPPEHRDRAAIDEWLRSEPESLPFSDVWGDLEGLYRDGRRLETRRGGELGVRWVREIPAGAIRVHAPGKTRTFTRDELEEIWRVFRHAGMLDSRNIPARLSRDFSYLQPVLAELSYVEEIELAESYESLRYNAFRGLQLVPAKAKGARHQFELI